LRLRADTPPRQWRVTFHEDAWADLNRLTDAERRHIQAEVGSWVLTGPPSDDPVRVYDTFVQFEVFEHDSASCLVVYQIVDDTESDVSVVEVKRVRRRRSDEIVDS
jgi:hypothetical protein